MIVGELMTHDPFTVGADATAKSALRLLHENVVTTLPVVDADGLLVGVVSDIDLVRRLVSPDPRARVVRPAEPLPLLLHVRPVRDLVRLLSVSDATIAAGARRHPDSVVTCTLAKCRARREQARAFLEVAKLVLTEDRRDAHVAAALQLTTWGRFGVRCAGGCRNLTTVRN